MNLDSLIGMSCRYGSDEDYVLEGGGNTSYKEGGVMAVKASGTALADIDEEGFVFMDAAKLRAMTRASYPESDDEREACAIRDMKAARMPGQGEKRPSVESVLHALFPQAYVLHVHPAVINGLTCAVRGADAADELFAGMKKVFLWAPLTKPGFILSRTCAAAFSAHKERHGAYPKILMLQNHGIFVAGDSVREIDETMEDVTGRVRAGVAREPDFADSVRIAFSPDAEGGALVPGEAGDPGAADGQGAFGDLSSAAPIASALAAAYGEGASVHAVFVGNAELTRLTGSQDEAAPLMRPFTPDHIVYDKAYPLWLDHGADVAEAFRAFERSHGFKPKVALARGLGAFALGCSAHEAAAAAALLMDAVKIAVYSEAFGGPLALPDDFTSFILNWEIESYRQKQSFG